MAGEEIKEDNVCLLVVGCKDPMMWYAGLIGKTVAFVREEKEWWVSREDSGFINMIRKEDALIIKNTDDQRLITGEKGIKNAKNEIILQSQTILVIK